MRASVKRDLLSVKRDLLSVKRDLLIHLLPILTQSQAQRSSTSAQVPEMGLMGVFQNAASSADRGSGMLEH